MSVHTKVILDHHKVVNCYKKHCVIFFWEREVFGIKNLRHFVILESVQCSFPLLHKIKPDNSCQ